MVICWINDATPLCCYCVWIFICGYGDDDDPTFLASKAYESSSSYGENISWENHIELQKIVEFGLNPVEIRSKAQK